MSVSFDKTSSILDTVKKLCNISTDYDAFDMDILVFLNSAILDLTQNGIGPSKGFTVTDSSQTFEDFVGDFKNVGAVGTYIAQKTRLSFDPPTSSYVVDAIHKTLDELIWRLNLEAENYKENDNADSGSNGIATYSAGSESRHEVHHPEVRVCGPRFVQE